jgi:hypothetical protein
MHLPRTYSRGGYDIRTVQELLDHCEVRTTMIYTPFLSTVGQRAFAVRWTECEPIQEGGVMSIRINIVSPI